MNFGFMAKESMVINIKKIVIKKIITKSPIANNMQRVKKLLKSKRLNAIPELYVRYKSINQQKSSLELKLSICSAVCFEYKSIKISKNVKQIYKYIDLYKFSYLSVSRDIEFTS